MSTFSDTAEAITETDVKNVITDHQTAAERTVYGALAKKAWKTIAEHQSYALEPYKDDNQVDANEPIAKVVADHQRDTIRIHIG